MEASPTAPSRNPDTRDPILLRAARHALGLKLKDISERAGIAVFTLSNLEIAMFGASSALKRRLFHVLLDLFRERGVQTELGENPSTDELRIAVAGAVLRHKAQGFLTFAANVASADGERDVIDAATEGVMSTYQQRTLDRLAGRTTMAEARTEV